jgi:acyl dehydratase
MSRTRYLEDFHVGERWESQPTTLTAEEIIAFGRANDPQPMHTDPERAAQGPFGSLIASGWQVASLAMRVFVQAGGYGDTPMVGMGIDELRWLKPVRPGDRLVVEREVVDVRRSESRPDRGVVRTHVTARNQDGERVLSFYSLGSVPARPPAAEGPLMLTIDRPGAMTEHVGRKLGASDWFTIDQTMIDTFAATTGDDHWIHVDVERARRELPAGRTIAHGLLTLSLVPKLQRTIWTIAKRGRGLNYGYNRVRFTGPVPVGSRVRLHQTLKAAEPADGAVRMTFESTVEVEGASRPALVAETIVLIYEA